MVKGKCVSCNSQMHKCDHGRPCSRCQKDNKAYCSYSTEESELTESMTRQRRSWIYSQYIHYRVRGEPWEVLSETFVSCKHCHVMGNLNQDPSTWNAMLQPTSLTSIARPTWELATPLLN